MRVDMVQERLALPRSGESKKDASQQQFQVAWHGADCATLLYDDLACCFCFARSTVVASRANELFAAGCRLHRVA